MSKRKVYRQDLKPYLQNRKWLATLATLLFLIPSPFILMWQILNENRNEIKSAYADLFAVIAQRYHDE